jgi:hypothetical protein
MLVNPDWLFVALAFVALVLAVGLSLGAGFAACVWKPEYVYSTLQRVRHFFVRPHYEDAVSAWSVD